MSGQSRHLPLMILSVIMLCAVSCGTDEPRRTQDGGSTPVPFDTTHRNDTTPADTTHHGNNPSDTTGNTTPSDTTHHSGNDTTATFTITLNAPLDYGYMGQTMQLNAVTTRPTSVTWKSSRPLFATVDADGMVTFSNTDRDGNTVITATANGVSDSVTLTNRCWKVAARSGNGWSTADYLNAHPGDTIVLTIVDSQAYAINDKGFNAGACQWTASSRNADISKVVGAVTSPAEANNWRYTMVITPDAPAGAIIIVMAQYGDAASALSCVINR